MMSKNRLMLLLLAVACACMVTAGAAQEAASAKQNPPTQAQLALDHGPRAQVTPAVKRKRLDAQHTQSN